MTHNFYVCNLKGCVFQKHTKGSLICLLFKQRTIKLKSLSLKKTPKPNSEFLLQGIISVSNECGLGGAQQVLNVQSVVFEDFDKKNQVLICALLSPALPFLSLPVNYSAWSTHPNLVTLSTLFVIGALKVVSVHPKTYNWVL